MRPGRVGGLMLQAALVAVVSLATCAVLRQVRPEPEPAPRPSLYIISVSRIAYRDDDRWLVEYAVDGRAEAVEVPCRPGEPDGYLVYLSTLGTLSTTQSPGPESLIVEAVE